MARAKTTKKKPQKRAKRSPKAQTRAKAAKKPQTRTQAARKMLRHSAIRLPSQAELDAFFTNEAALLDEWRLEEWTALLDEDVRYLVPSLDKPDADYRDSLFLVSDDRATLLSRVRQLLGKTVWAETPRSRTRRLVTNARVLDHTNAEFRVTANFAVWRFQLDQTDVYVGRYVHRMVRGAGGRMLFRERKAVMDLESLRPHGKLSFIL